MVGKKYLQFISYRCAGTNKNAYCNIKIWQSINYIDLTLKIIFCPKIDKTDMDNCQNNLLFCIWQVQPMLLFSLVFIDPIKVMWLNSHLESGAVE